MAKRQAKANVTGARVLQLVRSSPVRSSPAVSSDIETIEACEQLLTLARRGELVGLAFVGIVPGGKAFTDATGEAYRDPFRARGAVCALSEALGDLSRGRTPHGWGND